jgi:hypothetical protein
MKKALIALAAVATIVVTLTATVTDASAQRRRGGAIAAGVLGGLAVGAIIASQYPRTYAVQPGYETYPAYGVAPAYGCPGGYWARRPLRDRWGNVVGYSRPRFFCP